MNRNRYAQTFRRRLESKRVILEPLAPWHLDSLHEIVNSDELLDQWPLFGKVVSRPDLEEFLWSLAQLQFAILRRDNRNVIGLIQGLDDDKRSRTIGLGAAIDPALWRHGWPFEAVVLFLGILFDVRGYRKVYISCSDTTVSTIGAAIDKWLMPEALYRKHHRTATRLEDWHIYSLHRDRWDPSLVQLVSSRDE